MSQQPERFAAAPHGVDPVFCDRCGDLALAVAEGVPLCTDCLVRKVSAAGHGSSWIRRHLSPLPLCDKRRESGRQGRPRSAKPEGSESAA